MSKDLISKCICLDHVQVKLARLARSCSRKCVSFADFCITHNTHISIIDVICRSYTFKMWWGMELRAREKKMLNSIGLKLNAQHIIYISLSLKRREEKMCRSNETTIKTRTTEREHRQGRSEKRDEIWNFTHILFLIFILLPLSLSLTRLLYGWESEKRRRILLR